MMIPYTDLRWLWKKIQYMPEFLGMIMYFIYTMSVPVFEQYFFKRYSDEYGYSYSIGGSSSKSGCQKDNFTDPALVKVQDAVSEFLAINSFCLLVPSIFFGLFYGPLSDRVGRKPVIFLNVLGFFLMSVVVLLVELLQLNLWVVHIGAVCFGIGGYFPMGSMILQTYVSDVVEADRLPARIGLLTMVLFTGLSISNYISGILLKALGFLHTFFVIVVLSVVVLLLILLQLAESLPKEKRVHGGGWLKIPKRIWLLLKVPRPGKWKFYFLIPTEIFSAFLQQSSIGAILLLRLLNTPFCWSPVDIGTFRGTVYMTSGIGSALLIQFLPKLIHKGCVIVTAFLSACVFNVLFGFASSTLFVYLAVAGGIFMNAHTPMSRGIMSSIVNDFERGTLFGFLSTLVSLFLLLSTYTYQSFYRVGNENGKPGVVFLGIGCVAILPILIMVPYIVRDINYESVRENTETVNHENEEDDDIIRNDRGDKTPIVS